MAENSKSSVMKLNEENYGDWSMMMEAILVRKQLWDIVNGEKTRPMGSENSAAVKGFIRKQAEARAELVLAVESSQLPHLRNSDPAKIWEDLKNIHEARGLASRLALRRKFLWLSKAEDQPMQNWIATVRHTAFRLTQIGVEVSEEDFILVLTQGLPTAYETFVVSLDATDPSLLTSEHVISRLLNEEVRQLALNRDHEPQTTQKDTAFYVNSKKTPIERITCFKCQKKGHYQSQCPQNKSGDQANAAAMEDSENGIW
jgi:hypothetical protein